MRRNVATAPAYVIAVLFSALAPSTAWADGPALASLEVFPPDVNLNSSRDRQSLVVQATYADGTTRDVTADGTTELKVEFGGKAVTAAIHVKDAKTERPVSFKLDVMPVFMKAGCNQGSCHGAARGKDGFRLSLFGFDPDGDYDRLTREIPGRRINLALPHASLMLEKGAGRVNHTGGKRFDEQSELYQAVLRWLEAGTPSDPAEVAKPVSVELYPKGGVLDGKGATQQMTVRARYSDLTDRDVTSLAYFLSNNDTSATISPAGLVTAGDRGEAFLMARFATFTVGSQFIVLPKGLQFAFPEVKENNYVDTLVNAKLKKLRIAPSGLCSDDVFRRRASLDIAGVLPTLEDYNRFMARTEPNKGDLLVDELLARKEFAEV